MRSRRSDRRRTGSLVLMLVAAATFPTTVTVANPSVPVMLTSGTNAADLTAYPLGSLSFEAGHLYVAFLTLSETSSSLDATPGVVGDGTTWLPIGSGEASKGGFGVVAYRFQPATDIFDVPLSTDQLSTTHEGLIHTIVDVGEGFDTAVPIAQYRAGSSSAATSMSLGFPSAPAADSLVIASFAHAASEGSTPNLGWTEVPGSDQTHVGPKRGVHVLFDDTTPGQEPGSSWTTSSGSRGLAIEIRAEGEPPLDGVRLAAAGDICGKLTPCLRTSNRVLESDPDVVVTTGDLAYPNGTVANFRDKYCGNYPDCIRWGRPAIQGITLPGYGNHDCYDVPRDTGRTKQGCDGAVEYFGPDTTFGTDVEGTPGSYWTVRGDWLIVMLNSAGNEGSGAATPSEIEQQRAALEGILGTDDHLCELVAWHHPRYASGDHGNNLFVDPWFDTAYDYGVDVVLNGHAHSYERFAPQDGDGNAAVEGVREFVIGTGGAALDPQFGPLQPNSEASIIDYGVLTMALGADSYTWSWLRAGNGAVGDSGSDSCHS